jgi:NAD(P)-dependent dehydrogenase (short-subunit alcohol dehydrogenase family)
MSDSFRLDGKVALVRGASGGLGAAIALGLAEAGADVACHGNSRSPSQTATTVESLGRGALAVQGDLALPESPEKIVADVISRFGREQPPRSRTIPVRATPAESRPHRWGPASTISRRRRSPPSPSQLR